MQPMFALHKSSAGEVLDASAFKYSHNRDAWIRDLDIRPGDTIEFKAAATRPDEDEPFIPDFAAPAPPNPAPEHVAADSDDDVRF